jgi:glycosyltransferase involved in cell wall biosynthesis
MKVLIVTNTDIIGGAARAAYRIHRGLQSQGINSTMLVQRKASDDPKVIGPQGNRAKVFNQLRPHVDALPLKFCRNREDTEWSVGWLSKNLSGQINRLSPDIINLHWITGGFLPFKGLRKLNIPLVWTLQDCWAFTGGCHYPFDCNRYQEKCGYCPQLRSKHEWDLSRWNWNQKVKYLRNLNLTVVAISSWVADYARSSSLLKDNRIEIIPNGLDTQQFKAIEKRLAREILNLPFDKILVLFGAMHLSQKRKGFHLLSSALEKLNSARLFENMELVVFGTSPPDGTTYYSFPVHNLGYLHDDYSLDLLYSACDVFVAPSIQEAFGQTVSEAMACGTPAVSFNIGGFPDLIDNQENGYLARPFDTEDLARGIAWVVAQPDRHSALSRAARTKVEQKFSLSAVSGKYQALFQELLS